QTHASQRFSRDHPRERHPGVVRCDASGIRPRGNLYASVQYLGYRWGRFGGFGPVALNKVLTLIGHTVLHCNAAAQLGYTFNRFIGYCFSVVEEPVKTLQRDVLI